MRFNRQFIDRILTYIMFAGALYVLVFLILKAIGVIRTPMWIEWSPLIAGVLTGIAFIAKFMEFVATMRPLPGRVNRMARGLTELEVRFKSMEDKFGHMEQRFWKLEQSHGRLSRKVGNLS